jgi:hypothetical protein
MACGAASLALAGPEFTAYEGKNAVNEGDGGERKTVDGIDFWIRGAPPRKFKVLGSLADRRHETGIYGAIRMSSLQSDIAKAAKQAGGDAVILAEEGEEIVGHAAFANTNLNGGWSGGAVRTGNAVTGSGSYSGNAFTSAFSRDVKKHDARYVVVKYLDDGTPQAGQPSTPGPAEAQGPAQAPGPAPRAP